MTTTTTTTTTKTRFINGANELKRTIQEYVDMTHEMKMRFEHDIESPLAKIDPSPICRPLHDFNARQCAVTHRDFIRKVALESDELSGPATNMNATLDTLEKLRKMLVTNKQQRKTAHKNNRHVANSIQTSFQSTELEPVILVPESMMHNYLTLKQMDDTARQHHRTVARNILEEVNRLLAQIRGRFIVAYQVALDDAIGKIIQHADKCRRYIQRTMRLAVIEFCASRWFHSKKDAMDQTEYFLTAGAEEEEDDNEQSTTGCDHHRHSHQFAGITVAVHNVHDNRHVMTLHLDNDSYSREILTEEAIQAFEWEQQRLWFDKAEMERHANYERELAQFYADQARDAVAAAVASEEEEKKWDELVKQHEEEEQEKSWTTMGYSPEAVGRSFDEMEIDSDYDTDGYWG